MTARERRLVSRAILVLLLIGFCWMMLGCSPCRRAQKHIAKAMVLCPEVMRTDSGSGQVKVPGDSAQGSAIWTQEKVDSLLAACDQYAEALFAERELYRIGLNEAERRAASRKPQASSYKPKAGVSRAASELREAVCEFGEVEKEDPDLYVHIWYDKAAGRIRYDIQCKPKVVEVKVPCPPQVAFDKDMGWAAPWWLVLLVIGCLVALALYLLRLNATVWKQQQGDR